MQLLTRESDYALRALLCIAQSEKRVVSAAELVEKLEMPRAFTRKILQKLDKAGILISLKGNRGGFSLGKKPKDIFVVDIMNTFQGKLSLTSCLFKSKLCSRRKTCPLRRQIISIEELVFSRLATLAIDELLKG